MDRATVIVALPEVDDKVYKISSEKVPHLTLCYLGDVLSADALIEIVEFTKHAASQLSPFGLTVDYRDTLGLDEADVLFFDVGPSYAQRIKEFRHYLLQSDTIKKYYDTAPQFEEWTPHLTLGYPDAPAKEDTSDYPGIHYVSFDRIAVWLGEFEGPTFRLKYEESAMEVAMSDMTTNQRGANVISELFHNGKTAGERAVDELFHYGKKGMRWGVTTVDKASQPTRTQDTPARRGSKEVTVTQKKAGKYVKTKGGQRQAATDDAVKAAAARQKAKKSTTDSLTNDELRAAVERMNLEQQYSKLESKTKRRGESFISKLFQSPEGKKVTADLAKRVAATA